MDKFFSDIQKTKQKPPTTDSEDTPAAAPEEKKSSSLPKGVVLGKDGKP